MVRSMEQMFAIQDEILRTQRVIKMEMIMRKIPHRWPTFNQYISTFSTNPRTYLTWKVCWGSGG